MNEQEFCAALRDFHGPEKYTELRRISLFGKKIDLFRFYEAAKSHGGSTESVIMTRWRDICWEIGALEPGYQISVEEAHKASCYFFDCFHMFLTPKDSTTFNTTRYGRKTKPKSFPNNYHLPYMRIKNRKVDDVDISVDDLMCMVENFFAGPENKLFQDVKPKSKPHGKLILDNHLFLRTEDLTTQFPPKIQTTITHTTKTGPESKLGEEDQSSKTQKNGDDTETNKTEDGVDDQASPEQTIEDLIKDAINLLDLDGDAEMCLSIILKGLMALDLKQVPLGLVDKISQIIAKCTEELPSSKNLKRQKDALNVLELSCNILTLVARDSFFNFSKTKIDAIDYYNQAKTCIESLKTMGCVLFGMINDLFNSGAFEQNSFNVKIPQTTTGKGQSPNEDKESPKVLVEEVVPVEVDENKSEQASPEKEKQAEKETEEYVNHLNILSSIFLLIRYLGKISTESTQFDLVSAFIEPFLEVLSEKAEENGVPEFWMWDDFQDALFVLVGACNHVCIKMGRKARVTTVTKFLVFSGILVKQKMLYRPLLREVLKVLIVLNTNFNFNNFSSIWENITDMCENLVEMAVELANVYKQQTDEHKELVPEDYRGEMSNNDSYYSKDALDHIEGLKNGNMKVCFDKGDYYTNPGNPMQNPWSLFLSDYSFVSVPSPNGKNRSRRDSVDNEKENKNSGDEDSDDDDFENQECILPMDFTMVSGPGLETETVTVSPEHTTNEKYSKISKETVPTYHVPTLHDAVSYLQDFYRCVFGIPFKQEGDHLNTRDNKNTPKSGIKHDVHKKQADTTKSTEPVDGEDFDDASLDTSSTLNPDESAPSQVSGEPEADIYDDPTKYLKSNEALGYLYLPNKIMKPFHAGSQSFLMDDVMIKNVKTEKTTSELVCGFLTEMTKYQFCNDIFKTNHDKLMECASISHLSGQLFNPIIHKIPKATQ